MAGRALAKRRTWPRSTYGRHMKAVPGGAASPPAPLSHLRVLELPGGVATRYCGRLFAQLGATVMAAGPDQDEERGRTAGAGSAYAQWLEARQQRGPAAPRAGAAADRVSAGQDEGALAQPHDVIDRAGSPAPSLLAIRWFDPRG